MTRIDDGAAHLDIIYSSQSMDARAADVDVEARLTASSPSSSYSLSSQSDATPLLMDHHPHGPVSE